MKKPATPPLPKPEEVVMTILQKHLQQNVGAALTPALATGILQVVCIEYKTWIDSNAKPE